MKLNFCWVWTHQFHCLTFISYFLQCQVTQTEPADGIDNDCDGVIDEETKDGIDNDGDGRVDEDLELVMALNSWFSLNWNIDG